MLSPRLARLINEKNKILPFSQRFIHIIQSGLLMNVASSMIMPFLSRDFKEHVSRKIYFFISFQMDTRIS